MALSWRLHFGWVALTIAGVAATIALGRWQAGRAEEKERQAERFMRGAAEPILSISEATQLPPDAREQRRVRVDGQWLVERTVMLDNRILDGKPGYRVIGSLRPLGENRPLLVDRGWIVANAARRTEPPAIRTPDGTVTVEGRIHSRFPRALLSGDPTPGAVRQNLEIEEFSRETRMEFLPFVIEQSSFSEDGLIRRDTAAGPGSEKHRMYSLQWYSFAGLIVVLAGVFGIRRR